MTRKPIRTHRVFTLLYGDEPPVRVIRMPYEDFVALHPFRYVEYVLVNIATGEERRAQHPVPEWLVECNRCGQRVYVQEHVYKLVELDVIACERCAVDTLMPWCKEVN